MSGTSYLAVVAVVHRRRAAAAPGRDQPVGRASATSTATCVMRGGMPDTGFAAQLQDGSFFGKNRKEDILDRGRALPADATSCGRTRSRTFDRITVPAYVVASYSNTLHTAGTFRAWRRMASQDKWLRIHNSQEWPDYYDEANVEDLRRFFDRYLKGEDNGWEQTPRVRYSRPGPAKAATGSASPPTRSRPADVTADRSTTSTAARAP